MYYYQHHIGDYRRDTSHLTLLEHGIYRQLLDLYYITEKPLDANALRLISARTTDEMHATQQILSEFFTLENGLYYHSRCEDEIAKFHEKSNKASASAKARWNKNNNLKDANALRMNSERNANHKPITNNHKPKINTPDGVALTLWSDFLTLRKAKKLPITQTALDGINREAEKAGLTIAQAITICCERGWGGFKADWLKAEAIAKEKEDQSWRNDDVAMMKKARELGVNTTGKTRFEVIAAIDKKRGAI